MCTHYTARYIDPHMLYRVTYRIEMDAYGVLKFREGLAEVEQTESWSKPAS